MAVGGLASMYYVTLTLTERLGHFEKEGVEVEFSDFAGGSRALQAVMGGSADVVAAGFDAPVTMQGMNQNVRCFMQIARTAQLALVARKEVADRYKGSADLRGLKIGVTAPGSSTHLIVSHLLTKAGLTQNDVSIIGVGGPASSYAAFIAGNIDVLSQADPMITLCERAGGVVIADARTPDATREVFGGPFLSTTLSAPASYLTRNRDAAQRVANAVARTLRWMPGASAEQVADLVPPAQLLDNRPVYVEAFAKTRAAMTPDGRTGEEGARNTVAALAAFTRQIDPARIDFGRLYTNEFADAAMRAPA